MTRMSAQQQAKDQKNTQAMFQKLIQLVTCQWYQMDTLVEKASNDERRFCFQAPYASDVNRAASLFAQGDSWSISPESASALVQLFRTQTMTLGQLKNQCDQRSLEQFSIHLVKFYIQTLASSM